MENNTLAADSASVAVAPPVNIVLSVVNSTYSLAKLTNCDFTAAGTAPACSMNANETDPRVNAFIEDTGGTPTVKVDVCNRSGSPGTLGSGTHYIIGSSAPASLPAATSSLSSIANPYAILSYKQIAYFADNDTNVIQAVEMSGYTIIFYGDNADEPAFTFNNPGSTTNCGVDLELVQEGLDCSGDPLYFIYALFNCGSSYSGPWANSVIVRLSVDESGSPRGSLIAMGSTQAGMNANGLVQVKYKPAGDTTVEATYLLVSAIGGIQQQNAGNGKNSVISVLTTGAGFSKIADAVVGTFCNADTTLALDFKSLAATPTFENDAFIYIMASTYDASYNCNWTVRQTTASAIISKAIAIQSAPPLSPVAPYTLDDFTEIDSGIGTPGYFWAVAFAASGTGVTGKLVVGRGHNTGDQLNIYVVTASGIVLPASPEVIDSATLFGAGTSNNHINSMTIVPNLASASPVTKILRSHHPHPAATVSASARADFEAKHRKIDKDA